MRVQEIFFELFFNVRLRVFFSNNSRASLMFGYLMKDKLQCKKQQCSAHIAGRIDPVLPRVNPPHLLFKWGTGTRGDPGSMRLAMWAQLEIKIITCVYILLIIN
jgi:hypothetical protein